VDHFLEQDPQARVRAGCAVATSILFIAARFVSEVKVDIPNVARKVIGQIGYLQSDFDARTYTAGGTGLCIVFGHQIFQVLPSQDAVLLGAALLVGMGVWVIRQEIRGRSRQDQEAQPSGAALDLSQELLLQRMILILKNSLLADRDSSGQASQFWNLS